MGRGLLTFLGLAVVALLAIYVARVFLHPAKEKAERDREVLTKAYEPRLEEFGVLENDELGELGIDLPAVGSDTLYLSLVLFYPGAARAPDPHGHALDRINGHPGTRLEPVRADAEAGEEGTYVYLVFRTTDAFRHARLVCDGRALIKRVALE